MKRFLKKAFAGAAFMALAGTAMASGPEWCEDGDAPDLPGGQGTMGIGTLGFISGNLGMTFLTGPIDLVDMYLINIVDPMNFRVTTDPEDELGDAFAQFDTQLWLFRPTEVEGHALGVMGNDSHFD